MKECTGCGTEQSLDGFHKDKKGKLGRVSTCKKCVQERHRNYYLKNQEVLVEKQRTFRTENAEVISERRKTYDATYRFKHPDKIRSAKRKAQAHRRAATLRATVEWADQQLIKDMYLEADYFQMHVDHIVPLQGKMVCGLHWEGNLQLLTPKENLKKSNKHYV